MTYAVVSVNTTWTLNDGNSVFTGRIYRGDLTVGDTLTVYRQDKPSMQVIVLALEKDRQRIDYVEAIEDIAVKVNRGRENMKHYEGGVAVE